MKRTQKSIINVIASVGTNAIILITAFIVQKALVSTMGGIITASTDCSAVLFP